MDYWLTDRIIVKELKKYLIYPLNVDLFILAYLTLKYGEMNI